MTAVSRRGLWDCVGHGVGVGLQMGAGIGSDGEGLPFLALAISLELGFVSLSSGRVGHGAGLWVLVYTHLLEWTRPGNISP